MTQSVGIHEAKTHLSRLVDRVLAGEEILLSRRGQVVARLVPARQQKGVELGWDRGGIEIADDFDAPLPGFSLGR